MPTTCCVCKNKQAYSLVPLRFFRPPSKQSRGGKGVKERVERRARWFRAIGKVDKDQVLYICSQHFIKGHPVDDKSDPDYVPSQNLPPSTNTDDQEDDICQILPPSPNRDEREDGNPTDGAEEIVIELDYDSRSHIHTLKELLADVDENTSIMKELKNLEETVNVIEEIISSDDEVDNTDSQDPSEIIQTTLNVDPHIQNRNSLEEPVLMAIKEAMGARKHAYCPYSKIRVGAALLTDCFKLYSACNIENKVESIGLCAERNVYSKALTEGRRKFKILVVVGKKQKYKFTPPCGDCLQFMNEFGDVIIYLVRPNYDKVMVTSLSALLPNLIPLKIKKESNDFVHLSV